jgi:putative peptidoglycan lipid II flippase
VLAAGVVQLAIVYVGVRNAGMSIGFRRPKMTPNVKRLLILALPAAVTGGITQINQLIGHGDRLGAATGAIAALQYADRIYQLPLGVVGVAVGVVLLPELPRALKGNLREAANLQNRSIEFVLFLTIAGRLCAVDPVGPIVRVLYERGAFHQENTAVVGGDPGDLTASACRPSC